MSGFGNSFVKGLQEGENAYLKIMADQRAQEAADRDAADFKNRQADRARVEGAWQSYDADSSGLTGNAELGAAQDAAQGPVQTNDGTVHGAPGLTVKPKQLTNRDKLSHKRKLATGLRDTKMLGDVDTELKTQDRLDDQRSFVKKLRDMSMDPEQAAGLQQELAPAMKAFSEFSGIPSNFHFDPKTHTIVETPYGQKDPKTGKVIYPPARAVGLDEAMPYLLAHRALTAEYGDPETASKVMSEMSDKQRQKLLDDANRTHLQAIGLSNADAAQRNARSHEIQAGAAASRAAADAKPRLGQPITLIGANGEPQIIQTVMGGDGRITATPVELPAGSRLPKQVDPAAIERRAQALIGTPTGATVNGKPEVYNANTAYAAAQSQLENPKAQGGSGLPIVSAPPERIRPSAQVQAPQAQSVLQQKYEAWQKAKGPWYLPTPGANAEVDRLEQEYLQELRNPR